MSNKYWEHLEHGADIGIRGSGNTLAEAFEQVALALNAVVSDLSSIEPKETIEITCNENDTEQLLYDWLNALIYEMNTRKMLFSQFKVVIDDGFLSARVTGESIDIQRHQPAVEIKGATYTGLVVREKSGQWLAQCVVDV